MTITDIISASGVSMAEISRRFGIPYRTLQGWAHGERKPPEYVLRLLAAALKKD